MLKDWGKRLLNLLYPPRCLLCGDALSSAGLNICEACLPRYEAERAVRCPVCGREAGECFCGSELLLSLPPYFPERPYVVSRFYDPGAEKCPLTRMLILRCKGVEEEGLASFLVRDVSFALSSLFSASGEALSEWVVTYTPRSQTNLLKAGFDHGKILASSAARYLGIRMVPLFTRSVAGDQNQKELSAIEREENARVSFVPIRERIVPGGKYILFDDVITTGATMASAAALLYENGASAVLPAAIAKTL